MNYDVDADKKWGYLVGLYSPGAGQIASQMQLYNFERKQQQLLEGYAACFANLPVTDSDPSYKNSLFAFVEKKVNETQHKLHIMEIGNPAPNAQKFKISVDMAMAPDAPGDFPVIMQVSPKFGLIFVITKFGYFFMYEASKGALIYRQRLTDQLVFASVRNMATDGMICINKAG